MLKKIIKVKLKGTLKEYKENPWFWDELRECIDNLKCSWCWKKEKIFWKEIKCKNCGRLIWNASMVKIDYKDYYKALVLSMDYNEIEVNNKCCDNKLYYFRGWFFVDNFETKQLPPQEAFDIWKKSEKEDMESLWYYD